MIKESRLWKKYMRGSRDLFFLQKDVRYMIKNIYDRCISYDLWGRSILKHYIYLTVFLMWVMINMLLQNPGGLHVSYKKKGPTNSSESLHIYNKIWQNNHKILKTILLLQQTVNYNEKYLKWTLILNDIHISSKQNSRKTQFYIFCRW